MVVGAAAGCGTRLSVISLAAPRAFNCGCRIDAITNIHSRAETVRSGPEDRVQANEPPRLCRASRFACNGQRRRTRNESARQVMGEPTLRVIAHELVTVVKNNVSLGNFAFSAFQATWRGPGRPGIGGIFLVRSAEVSSTLSSTVCGHN